MLKNGELYKSLFENMLNGFAHCQVVREGDVLVDWTYLIVNPAFERLTGLKNVVGKRVTELIPGIQESNPKIFEVYNRVSLTGIPERIEVYIEQMNSWYDISVYRSEPDTFTAVFDNITGDLRIAAELAESHSDLKIAYDETIKGWVSALGFRNAETLKHSFRVTDLALKLVRAMNFYPPYFDKLRYGMMLHDIGKLGVPDRVLLKPGTLEPEERLEIQKHTIYAYEMLKPIKYLEKVIHIPYCHHEKFDGSGYPRGLSKSAIPMAARIFSVVDVFDAMSSTRPYRPALSETEVLNYIQMESGKSFDPSVVKSFIALFPGYK